MWSILLRFLSGRIWQIMAAGVIASCIFWVWNAGKDSEKAKNTKAIEKSVKVSNAIQNKNRRASDTDIFARLQRWIIDCE